MNRSDESTARASVAVVSTAKTVSLRESGKSLEEMIFETTSRALSAANLTIDDIDDVVLSGNDEIDGRVISCMPSAGPAGGVGRDTTMIASSGDHALVYAYLRLLAAQSKRLLVVGWSKPSESVDPDRAELMAAEPFLLRGIGMNHTIAAALQASRLAVLHEPQGEVVAWPLGRDDLPGRGDSVFAAVLALEGQFERGTERAWILDAGWVTGPYELGSRDLGEFSALELATDQIRRRTPSASPEFWDAVEIAADSKPAVSEAARALQLPVDVPVNGSGSVEQKPTSPYVAGLGRMIEAIDQVGDAGRGMDRVVAGVGFNGFAGQGATVMVFSSTKDGVSA